MARIAPVAALAAALAVAGCQEVSKILSGLEKPTVRVTGARIEDLGVEALTLGLLLEVENPYSVPLPVVGLRYGLSSGGKTFLDGTTDESRVVPAYGKGNVPMTARLPFAGLLSALSGVRPGSVFPYEAAIGLFVDAPGAGRLELPLTHRGELPVPAPPDVALEGVRWDDLSVGRIAGTISLGLRNVNEFPVDLSAVDLGLRLAGVELGRVAAARPLSFAPGGRQTLDLPVSFSPAQAGLSLVRMLSGEAADYALTGGIDAKTPFGALRFPVSGAGRTALTR